MVQKPETLLPALVPQHAIFSPILLFPYLRGMPCLRNACANALFSQSCISVQLHHLFIFIIYAFGTFLYFVQQMNHTFKYNCIGSLMQKYGIQPKQYIPMFMLFPSQYICIFACLSIGLICMQTTFIILYFITCTLLLSVQKNY